MSTDDYRQASLQVWEAMAAGWERERAALWDVSRGVGEWLVDALDPQPGETVLELAAGLGDTGFAAAARVGSEGRLITTDFSGPMVEAARRHAEELGIENAAFRQMDAEHLALEDDSVDGVVCRWGYMLMADPVAAFRETRRVLRDGGRVALSVWGAPERNPWASIPGQVVIEHTGAPPPDPTAPGIFAMADEGRTRELLTQGELEARRVEELTVRWAFESFDDFWRFVVELAGGLAMMIRALPGDEQAAVREKLQAAVASYRGGDGGYEFDGMCLNVLARP
jgi:SAM-dependent methyltransferase